MYKILDQFNDKIKGTFSFFDRMIMFVKIRHVFPSTSRFT